MSNLIFGIFWMAIVLPCTIAIFSSGKALVLVFLVPFWAVGIGLIYSGFKQIKTDSTTNVRGQHSYGLIVDFSEAGTYVNGRPVWNAHVLVVTEHDVVRKFVEEVGLSPKFDVGNFVSVKYYNDDANILDFANPYSIPQKTKEILTAAAPKNISAPYDTVQGPPKTQYQDFIVEDDAIIIDGVKYKRPTK